MLALFNFKSGSCYCQINFSLKDFLINHSAINSQIKAANFLLHGSVCIDWLQSIRASELLFKKKYTKRILTKVYHNILLSLSLYIFISYKYMINHSIYSNTDQSKTIKGSWIFYRVFTIFYPTVEKQKELVGRCMK